MALEEVQPTGDKISNWIAQQNEAKVRIKLREKILKMMILAMHSVLFKR